LLDYKAQSSLKRWRHFALRLVWGLHVRFWHLADITTVLIDVRYWA